jgi:hypothetical protein
MQERALDFSQEFGLSIFRVVSVLTSGLTLGECMSAASGNTGNTEAVMLGTEISEEPGQTSPGEIEEIVYAMAVWLRSHEVVVGMEEYLVAVGVTLTLDDKTANADKSNAGTDVEVPVHPEDALYKELADVLTGNVSTVALCWRYGIDALRLHRFRSWGVFHNKLRVVTRVPSPNDDWNTKESKQ